MKKFKFLFVILLFLGGAFIVGCNSEKSNTENSANLEYKEIGGVKHVFGTNVTNTKIVQVSNGVICFFNVDEKEKTYTNAITFIPVHKSDITKIESFLLGKSLSFDYELTHMQIKNTNSSLMFFVTNETGHKYRDAYSGHDEVIELLQLSFMKRKEFLVSDLNKDVSVNDYIQNLIYSNSNEMENRGGDTQENCTSGGTGSTSCSVNDVWSGCSVSCGVGYYACCVGDSNTCSCIAY